LAITLIISAADPIELAPGRRVFDPRKGGNMIKLVYDPDLFVCAFGMRPNHGTTPISSGRVPEAKDMSLVGYSDLQARSAYQPVIHRQRKSVHCLYRHHGGQALNP